MFPIQRGVPPPAKPYRSRKYPLEDMDVGDWFFVPGDLTLTSHLSVMGRKLKCKFSSRRAHMRLIQQHVDKRERWEPCAQSDSEAVYGTIVERTR